MNITRDSNYLWPNNSPRFFSDIKIQNGDYPMKKKPGNEALRLSSSGQKRAETKNERAYIKLSRIKSEQWIPVHFIFVGSNSTMLSSLLSNFMSKEGIKFVFTD